MDEAYTEKINMQEFILHTMKFGDLEQLFDNAKEKALKKLWDCFLDETEEKLKLFEATITVEKSNIWSRDIFVNFKGYSKEDVEKSKTQIDKFLVNIEETNGKIFAIFDELTEEYGLEYLILDKKIYHPNIKIYFYAKHDEQEFSPLVDDIIKSVKEFSDDIFENRLKNTSNENSEDNDRTLGSIDNKNIERELELVPPKKTKKKKFKSLKKHIRTFLPTFVVCAITAIILFFLIDISTALTEKTKKYEPIDEPIEFPEPKFNYSE